ncbi:YqfO family protein [Patescibacteria group bacterium]|nr:YqfO family protein [Patescibacteria group bacterium]
MSNNVKIVVFVPESHADAVREAMGEAGAGKIGNYTNCSFSSKGVGRFLPQAGANPAIGEVGKLEAVEEERIEMVCEREKLKEAISAIKRVHPYEEIAYDVYPLEDVK